MIPALTPDDIDATVRTVAGEAAGEPAQGQQAVASVIMNRAAASGQSPAEVVSVPGQFESWASPRVQKMTADSPVYQRTLQTVLPILSGDTDDPTGGATHFLNPTLQADLGRKQPAWASGDGQQIGNHVFYKIGYGGQSAPQGSAPSPQVQQNVDKIMASLPSSQPAPAPAPAEDEPLPSPDEVLKRMGWKDPAATPPAQVTPPNTNPAALAAARGNAAYPDWERGAYNTASNVLLGAGPIISGGEAAIGAGAQNALANMGVGHKAPFSMGDTFRANMIAQQQADDAYAKAHPVANALETVGGIAASGPSDLVEQGVSRAVQAAAPRALESVAGRVGTRLGSGAVAAGVYGGTGEAAEGGNVGQIAGAAGENAALAVPFGVAGEAAGKLAGATTSPLIKRALPVVAGAGIGAVTAPLVGESVQQGAMTGALGGALMGRGGAKPEGEIASTPQDRAAALDLVSAKGPAPEALEAQPDAQTSMEAMGPQGAALAQRAAAAAPAAIESIKAAVAQRAEDLPVRLATDIQSATGIAPDTAKADVADQTRTARAAAKPLYDEALQGNGVWNDDLAAAAQHPIVAQALNQAQRLIGPDAMVDNPAASKVSATGAQKIDPTIYQQWVKSGSNDPAELMRMQNQRSNQPAQIPTDRTWDMAKQVLTYGTDRDAFGKPVSSPVNNAMAHQAGEITPLLKEAIPGYDKALGASGDYLSNQSAADLGAKQFQGGSSALGANDFAARYDKLSPGEQNATKAGYLGELYRKVEKGGFNPDSILQSPLHKAVLGKMFGDQPAGQILGALEREKTLAEGAKAIGKLKAPAESETIHPAAGAAFGLMTGGLHGAIHGAAEAAGLGAAKHVVKAVQSGKVTPKVAHALADILAQSPSKTAQELRAHVAARKYAKLSDVVRSPAKRAAMRGLQTGGAVLAGNALRELGQ